MTVDPKIIALYDEYTHAPLPRRVFLDRLAQLAGGTAAAAALLPLLEPSHAAAQPVPTGDPEIAAERAGILSPAGLLNGYVAHPAVQDGRLGSVVVIHENRGLNPHIEEVARRLAKQGFVAFAPDFLSRLGGTPTDADAARAMFGRLDPALVVEDARVAMRFVRNHRLANGKVGAVGFCWGGGVVGRLATQAPDLDAGVVFYGSAPATGDVAAIQSPLLLHYAGLDERINAGIPAFEAALKAAGKTYTLHMYEGVNHAFHNDTSPARYDAAAAKLAWDRTIAFFRTHLRAAG